MSTRKTVEYVSERVASSCVKYIYNNLLPVERQKNTAALKRLVAESGIESCNSERLKVLLLLKIYYFHKYISTCTTLSLFTEYFIE